MSYTKLRKLEISAANRTTLIRTAKDDEAYQMVHDGRDLVSQPCTPEQMAILAQAASRIEDAVSSALAGTDTRPGWIEIAYNAETQKVRYIRQAISVRDGAYQMFPLSETLDSAVRVAIATQEAKYADAPKFDNPACCHGCGETLEYAGQGVRARRKERSHGRREDPHTGRAQGRSAALCTLPRASR